METMATKAMTAEQAAEWGRTLSFEKVWTMFQETDKKFQETERFIKENAAELKETAQIVKENARELAKTERLVKELSKNIGGLNNDIGDFAEGLLTSDLLKKFEEYNLDFDDALRNVEINERGTKRPIAEIDWLLLNTTIALVGEAKANLTRGDVDKHLTRMKKLSSTQNGLLSGKKLYGAVAGIKMTQTTSDYAKKRGFFVLEPAGDSVKIEAPEGKPAVW